MNVENLSQTLVPAQTEWGYATDNPECWVLCTLKAPQVAKDITRPGVDIVLVIDRSSSMSSHMELMKKVLTFLVTELLRERDRVAIITYSTRVEVTLPFTEINENAISNILTVIESIHAEGCTNLGGGLFEALKHVQEFRVHETASILLMTDGLANQGITDTKDIIRGMCSEKFIGHYDRHKRMHSMRLCDDASTTLAVASCSLYTFGFGSTHNADVLSEMAKRGGGVYSYVRSAEALGAAFATAIGGVSSIVAQNVEIDCCHGLNATVVSVKTWYPTTVKQDGIHVVLSDMMAGESRDLLIQLHVPPVDNVMDMEPVCAVHTRYWHRLKQCSVTHAPAIVAIRRTLVPPVSTTIDTRVDCQLNRFKALHVLEKITQLANTNVEAARRLIQVTISALKESVSRNESCVCQLIEDLQQCEDRLQNSHTWHDEGAQVTHGYYTGHGYQRANAQCSGYIVSGQQHGIDEWNRYEE